MPTRAERPVAVTRAASRRYGSELVLDAIDLAVHPGEVLGLIGPNGGGKSTLLLLLAGLVRPSSGEVLVEGVPAADLALTRSGRIGLVTSRPGLYPLLTGRENLAFFGGLFGLTAARVDALADSIVAEVGLGDAMDRPVGTWSSGMQQKLSLVRALLLDPRLLLLDEPTSNLDPVASHAMHEAMRAAAGRGIAVVLVTHDLGAAEATCDRVGLLKRRLVHLEELPGARRPPAKGRLFELYAANAEDG